MAMPDISGGKKCAGWMAPSLNITMLSVTIFFKVFIVEMPSKKLFDAFKRCCNFVSRSSVCSVGVVDVLTCLNCFHSPITKLKLASLGSVLKLFPRCVDKVRSNQRVNPPSEVRSADNKMIYAGKMAHIKTVRIIGDRNDCILRK